MGRKPIEFQPLNFDGSEVGSQRLLGLDAEEVLRVLPQVVTGQEEGKDSLLSVNYSGLVPVLITAIQELTARVVELEGGLSAEEEAAKRATPGLPRPTLEKGRREQ